MNDNDLICEFLNMHYDVCLMGYDIYIMDKAELIDINENHIVKKMLSQEFAKTDFVDIFGDYKINVNKTSKDIFYDWARKKAKILDDKVSRYLDSLDYTKNSVTLNLECYKTFKEIHLHHSLYYIHAKINNNYFEKTFKQKVTTILSELSLVMTHHNRRDWTVIRGGAKFDLTMFNKLFSSIENGYQLTKLEDMYNDWFQEARVEATAREMKLY